MKVTFCAIRKGISPRVIIKAAEFHTYFLTLHLDSVLLTKGLGHICMVFKDSLSW